LVEVIRVQVRDPERCRVEVTGPSLNDDPVPLICSSRRLAGRSSRQQLDDELGDWTPSGWIVHL
jgi:hypothetical protein